MGQKRHDLVSGSDNSSQWCPYSTSRSVDVAVLECGRGGVRRGAIVAPTLPSAYLDLRRPMDSWVPEAF